MKNYSLFIFTVLFCLYCSSDNGNSTGPQEFDSFLNVRIKNETNDTLKVVIGPADFGFLAPNDSTDYMPVYKGDNGVYVNDTLHVSSPASFATGDWSCEMYWTFTFGDGGYGYSADQDLTNWDDC